MAVIKVEGMKCQHCVGSVTKALEGLDGISNVQVDLEKGQASFEGDIPVERVKEAVSGKGFVVVE